MSPEVGTLDLDAVTDALAADPDQTLTALALMARATDVGLRRKVRALVPRLLIERAQRGPSARAGSAKLRRIRGAPDGDLDLDASLDAVVHARSQGHAVDATDMVAAAWQRPAPALCLVLDRSGSMEGLRLVTAALATAACVLRSQEYGGELAVVAFDRRAEALAPMGSPASAEDLVEQVMGMRGHGMTSLDAALREAHRQVSRSRAQRRIVLLLSDCRVTDDVDPLSAARLLEELVVIGPSSDPDQAREFAAAAGARVGVLESLDELPGLVDRLLS